jgi:hypothetical protein
MVKSRDKHPAPRVNEKQQRHAADRDQRAEDRLPVEFFFVEEIADRQHDDRRQGHDRAGDAHGGMLDGQQRGRDAEDRPKERAKDGPAQAFRVGDDGPHRFDGLALEGGHDPQAGNGSDHADQRGGKRRKIIAHALFGEHQSGGLPESGQDAEQNAFAPIVLALSVFFAAHQHDPRDAAQGDGDAEHLHKGQCLAEQAPGDDRTENGSQAEQQQPQARADMAVGTEQEGVAQSQTDHARKRQPAPAFEARVERDRFAV